MLNEYPTVRILHLNSNGGRLAEAEKLKNMVTTRNLDTYVNIECQSACVTVFVAGHNRLISKRAVIGLHRPFFPGTDDTEIEAIVTATEGVFLLAGYRRTYD